MNLLDTFLLKILKKIMEIEKYDFRNCNNDPKCYCNGGG